LTIPLVSPILSGMDTQQLLSDTSDMVERSCGRREWRTFDTEAKRNAAIVRYWADIQGAVGCVMSKWGRSDRALHDDLVSGSVLRLLDGALARFDSKRSPCSPRKFAMIVAERYCKNQLARHRNSRPHVEAVTTGLDDDTESTGVLLTGDTPDAAVQLAAAQERARLTASLSELSATEQAYLALVEQGRNGKEIAVALNTSSAGVTRIKQALVTRLKAKIAD